MFATVRNRRGITTSVEPFDGPNGRLHLVHVDYKDDQYPRDEQLIWELEPYGQVLEPTALPNVASSDPMPVEDYDALLRATRWSAGTPFIDPDGSGPLGRLPLASPFHGAVQVDDFQLVPLLKALRMPRVSLLLADDVGLGKTIEAGLILSELLLRRRVQRVLILTPASLRVQWRDEMWEKFSLPFDLVDRDETHALRKRLGMDANPWRSHSRIITSYHYLRQDDVLEQFLAASRLPEGSPHLPWDLLIVDECHNLMPSAFGDDSDLCRMLRLLAPKFEHRLFLSATPHNGHTRSFSGLLEILDPVRFSQTDQLRDAERGRVQQVVVRRLKREINACTNPPKFCTRLAPQALVLSLSPQEVALSKAFDAFRKAIYKLIASDRSVRRRSGTFAVEILGKRLLSCSVAFADSWHRCKQGLAEERQAAEAEVQAARRSCESETSDDREAQSRVATAAGVVGAWLKSVAPSLELEIATIDDAISELGLDVDPETAKNIEPRVDSRYDSLENLIEQLLRKDGTWRNDERLVVFTEYKTTLDYIVRRLTARYGADRVLTLFGGMDDVERSDVKAWFNDPSHSVRVLVATDAAAEGLNLQRTARYLLHFDCPWNPSRIEQRNGRIDRHGQTRDVTIFHFATDQDQDLAFLSHVIRKADEIREDLGSANEIFDEAAHRRLIAGESADVVGADLDRRIAHVIGSVRIDADATTATTERDGQDAEAQLKALASELDLDSRSLRDTLESAMAIRGGRPQLDCSDEPQTCRLLHPTLAGWADVVDESLRRPQKGGSLGPVARMAFDAAPFLQDIGGRLVFSPRPDVLMTHLSHPMMQQAISTLTRRRFPGTGEEVSRWTVRRAQVPAGVDALVLLSVEELAVNALRETFHHWVRTVVFPVVNGTVGAPLPHAPACELRGGVATHSKADNDRARDILEEVEFNLKAWIKRHKETLSADLRDQLEETGKAARLDEDQRYRSRQADVSKLISENTIAKLEREIAALKVQRAQGLLFGEDQRLNEIDQSIEEKRAEMARRAKHHEEVREQLDRERERILKNLLPQRHTMVGDVQVFPVSIEVRLPGGGA
ncbi:MAG: DNA helicase [Candidatus Kapabacteria bacterium]|nr:DNA helicase [Candidatus Kapabacteria bacterium]